MTSCSNDHVRDLLPDWVSGRIAPATRANVGDHLAGCATCRAEVALLERMRRALPAAAPVDVKRIVAALPRPPRRASNAASSAPAVVDIRTHRRRWQPSLRVAAAVAAILAGGSALVLARADHGDGRAPVATVADHATNRPGASGSAPAARVAAASSPAPADSVGDGLFLAYLDDADLTAAEYDAVMRDLEGTDEFFSPVAEPAVAPVLGDG